MLFLVVASLKLSHYLHQGLKNTMEHIKSRKYSTLPRTDVTPEFTSHSISIISCIQKRNNSMIYRPVAELYNLFNG